MNMNEIEGDYMSDKQESLLKLAELFKILGDPTRLKIVELLLENEMCNISQGRENCILLFKR